MSAIDTLQAQYEAESLQLVLEGFTHISDSGGDRFRRKTEEGEEIVKLYYHNHCGWRRISHKIIKRAD